jgi:hypothetical protein
MSHEKTSVRMELKPMSVKLVYDVMVFRRYIQLADFSAAGYCCSICKQLTEIIIPVV